MPEPQRDVALDELIGRVLRSPDGPALLLTYRTVIDGVTYATVRLWDGSRPAYPIDDLYVGTQIDEDEFLRLRAQRSLMRHLTEMHFDTGLLTDREA